MPARPTNEFAEAAAYGKLAFDRYVLDHWDYSRPVEQDQSQWNDNAKMWLQMDHIARSPYWEAIQPLECAEPNDPRMPTQEQIDRVLVPHQTISERNIATHTEPCIWMRTCYEPSLAPVFEEMTRDIRSEVWEVYRLFDNETLYGSVGSNLVGLYLRMPQLPDTVDYCGYPETEDLPISLDLDRPEEESKWPLYDAALKARGIMYLMDEEALKKKMLKLLWTDLSGNAVWWNWLPPSSTRDFEGHYYGLGHALHWLLEKGSGNSHYDEMGAILEIE